MMYLTSCRRQLMRCCCYACLISEERCLYLLAMDLSFIQTASFTRFEFGLKRGIWERAELTVFVYLHDWLARLRISINPWTVFGLLPSSYR